MLALYGSMLAQAQENAPDLMVAAVVIVLVLVVLAVLAAGVVLAAACIAAVCAAVAFGMISTSLLVGLKERRIAAGAHALLVQIAAVFGIALGAGVFVLAAWLAKFHLSPRILMLCAMLCGCMTGAGLSLLTNAIWKLALDRLAKMKKAPSR